jgi:hypothetical protein
MEDGPAPAPSNTEAYRDMRVNHYRRPESVNATIRDPHAEKRIEEYARRYASGEDMFNPPLDESFWCRDSQTDFARLGELDIDEDDDWD